MPPSLRKKPAEKDASVEAKQLDVDQHVFITHLTFWRVTLADGTSFVAIGPSLKIKLDPTRF